MAPGAIGDSCDDIISRARGRWTESSIVYTRRSRKKPKINSTDDDTATSSVKNPTTSSAVEEIEDVGNCATVSPPPTNGGLQDFLDASVANTKDDGSVQEPVERNYPNLVPEVSCSPTTEPQNPKECPNSKKTPNLGDLSPFSGGNDPQNSGEAVEVLMHESGKSDLPEGHDGPVNVVGVVKPLVISNVGDRIRFSLSKATPKDDIKELKRVLLGNLDQVARLVKQLEAKEIQFVPFNNTQSSNISLSSGNYYRPSGASISGYSHPQHTRHEAIDRRLFGHQEARPIGLSRVNSDMGTVRNMGPCPYRRQLSVSVMENNNRGGEFVEKEKRTPKANQFYRNSEFLLGKDRLPSESIKKQKLGNGRRHSGELNHLFGSGARLEKNKKHVFKNCSSLLQRLMKHKHGWVFNEPVNANVLGLVDYHDVIKHPMDLGTIKTRLSQNWYKTPMDFAEDVRLVFLNAMTYNPEGQDVHVMAKQLSDVFEERWAVIEFEYNRFNWKHQTYPEEMLPTPTSRRTHFDPSSAVSAPISLHMPVAASQMRAFDRPEPTETPMAVDPKIQLSHPRRTPAPRKPKAKDPDKRDMTSDEKQKLSTSLQGMPSEKLDAILQIIKRGDTGLSQTADEVEVDIDSVNIETLWELDRFVTNYKKSLSKNKRKAELALQARTTANQSVSLRSSVPFVANQIGSVAAFGKTTYPLAEGQKRVHNGSMTSSSSSSSSDSGSTSSDSDSDSSSADGSNDGNSPRA